MDDYNGPHPSSGEEDCDCDCDSSLQTRPPTPSVRDTCTGSDSQPPRSADIPPDHAPCPLKRWGTGLSLERAQEQAIQRWELPRRPEYGTLTKRTRTFYQEAAPWDPKEKPSVESIAEAGFYFEGGFIIIIIYISKLFSLTSSPDRWPTFNLSYFRVVRWLRVLYVWWRVI